MSSEAGSDSGREAMSWGRGQEEESSSGRMVEGIDDDEVLSPAPLTSVPPTSRSPHQAGTSGDVGGRPLGRREMEVESGQRTAPVWKSREFNSLYSFKSDGKRSGWWYASVKAKTGGSVVTQTPDSIQNWKKYWFFVRGYVSHDPTPGSIERAQRAQAMDESFRSSSALITEENLGAARLSSATSYHPRPRQSGGEMKDISALLKKKGQAGKGKRKATLEDQPPPVRARTQTKEVPKSVPSPARSVEEITSFPARGEPSSTPAFRPPPSSSQIPPTYLGSTPDRDEEYLKLRGSLPKPVWDFFRSNSPTRGDIVELLPSAQRAISVLGKSWTPVQQKYLDGMETIESIVAASVNTLRAAIQLTSAAEKMGRMLTDIQVMREEGRKVKVELDEERKLRASSEDILLRREEELKRKEDELRTLAEDLEVANRSRAKMSHELEVERKAHADLRTTLEKSVDKDQAVAEFKSSDAYLAEQEMVYFLTMEELIEATMEKRPDWDVQFLRDELSELKRKSTLNPPSPEEVDQDLAEQDQARSRE
ncbi:Uncharacterized protein Adt_06755 [Abeliophyllum distichum]|uniref:Uncharacterized protein n=1 Tax=Abeliophyllum distichum TaxID=126358 RepID=A0ABD1V7X6_9LAMI